MDTTAAAPPVSRRTRPALVALTVAVSALLAWLAYVGYRQPELVFQLAAFRLC